MDTEKLVSVYIKIRSAREDSKRAFEENDRKLKAQQGMIEDALLKFLHDNNVDSIRTDAGTCTRTLDVMPNVTDWDVFYKWIKEHDAFEALEKRVKKTFVKDYMTEEKELPPGVSVHQSYVVRVRRPN